MKNKGLSVFLSFVLVLMLAVSFSVPVYAADVLSIDDTGSISLGSTSVDFEGSVNSATFYRGLLYSNISNFSLMPGLSDDTYYRVNCNLTGNISFSAPVYMRGAGIKLGGIPIFFNHNGFGVSDSNHNVHDVNSSLDFIIQGSYLNSSSILFACEIYRPNYGTTTFDLDLDFSVVSCEPLSSSDSADYESGYNAGYSAGEESGYSSGYSSGFDDGFNSVDQDSIYDQGYQAGVDSVDTQSYYDAGYNSGYSAGLADSYESGYSAGYDDAMSRIENWGADTVNYPVLVYEDSASSAFSLNITTFDPFQYFGSKEFFSSILFDPNHTYRFDVLVKPLEYNAGSDSVLLQDDIWFFNIGGIKYQISNFDNYLNYESNVNSFFVPGNRISNAWSISWEPICWLRKDVPHLSHVSCHYDIQFSVYDMGPSGDTQNHIANQTDQLTNGYDAGSINQSNTALSGSIAEFTGAESQITDQSFGFIDQVQFYDLNMQPQLLACITFCSSWLQSLFVNIGDWGILVMVSLSLGFGLMLIGWFKYRRK